MKIFNELLSKVKHFDTTEGNESQIFNRVAKGKKLEITDPTSQRYYYRGDDGTFGGQYGGTHRAGTIENLGYGRGVGRPSTAVKSIEYNPQTGICSIVFVGGTKSYDYSMNQSQFDEFVNSSSKGRYVNYVMKINNRISGY